MFKKLGRFTFVILAITLALAASSAIAQSVVYDAVPSPLAPSYSSLAFHSTQTNEFGDFVHLGGTNRVLNTVTVTMVAWGLEANATNLAYCTSNPGVCSPAGWNHPFTVNIYAAPTGTVGIRDVAAPIATVTQTKLVPWRPAEDPINCPTQSTPGYALKWQATPGAPDTNCHNGFAANLTFDMSYLNTVLPNDIVVGISYNTLGFGSTPMVVGGPFDSLNVSVGPSHPVVAGTDDNTVALFWNTETPSYYNDGGVSGSNEFRETDDWGIYGTVAIEVSATATPNFVVDITDGMGNGTDCNAAVPAYTSIQTAINAAGPGDVVKVCPGTYNENVDVNKANLQLLGAKSGVAAGPAAVPVGRGTNEAIIVGQLPASVGAVDLTGNGAMIDGFTIRPRGIDGQHAVRLQNTSNSGYIVRNNIMEGNTFGTATSLSSSMISQRFNNAQFRNNNVKGFRYGMYIDGALTDAQSTISGNYITGSTFVNVMFAAGNAGHLFSDNLVENNLGSIILASGGNTFTGNTIRNNNAGISLQSHANNNNNTIAGNRFVSNVTGISINGALGTGNVARFNAIIGSTSGNGIRNDRAVAFDAENNWWGCNYGPGAGGPGCVGTPNGIGGTSVGLLDANPWLRLTTSASASPILVGGTSNITSLLTTNSDNATPGGGSVPDFMTASFVGTFGTVSPSPNTFTSGSTGTVFTGTAQGVGGVATTVDGQTVSAPITVYNAACVGVSIPSNIPTLRNVPVTVPINVDLTTGRNILGYVTTVTYDSTKLGYLGIVNAGTLSSGFTYTVDSSVAGTLQIFGFGPVPLSGAGTLLNLSFQANGTISAVPTPVSFSSFSFNEGNPTSCLTNGSVTIISGDITGRVTFALNGANGVPNVAMNATGTSPSVTTNTNYAGLPATWGNYTLNGFGSGPYTVTPAKAPQPAQSGPTINGITPSDSACIANWGVGQTCSTVTGGPTTAVPLLGSARFRAADVTKNGTLSPLDAAYIAQFSINTPNPGFAGTWEFIAPSTAYSQAQIETGMSGQDYTAILLGDVTGNWDPAVAGGNFAPTIDPTLQKDAVTATISEVQAAPGATVTVPVTIRDLNRRGVTAYQFDITYDPRVLEPMETSAGVAGTVSNGMSVVFNRTEAGLLRVAVYGASSIAGDGTLINLHFRAIGPVGTVSTLTLDSLVLNEGDVPVLTRNGQVSVASAAEGTIRGKLLTAFGQGVVNARVNLTSTTGEKRSVLSSSFGAFEFGGLTNGETYTLTVNSKRYTFSPRTVSISDAVTVLDIIAEQ